MYSMGNTHSFLTGVCTMPLTVWIITVRTTVFVHGNVCKTRPIIQFQGNLDDDLASRKKTRGAACRPIIAP